MPDVLGPMATTWLAAILLMGPAALLQPVEGRTPERMRIVDPSGEPIRDASVTNLTTGAVIAQADATGTFPRPSAAMIRVTSPGFSTFEGLASEEVRLARLATLELMVREKNSREPISGATISVVPSGGVTHAASTKPGVYRSHHERPGVARVQVRAPGFAEANRRAFLVAGETDRLELFLEPLATLHGTARVRGQAVVGAQVLVRLLGDVTGEGASWTARTDSEGRFSIDGIPEERVAPLLIIVHSEKQSVWTAKVLPRPSGDRDALREALSLDLSESTSVRGRVTRPERSSPSAPIRVRAELALKYQDRGVIRESTGLADFVPWLSSRLSTAATEGGRFELTLPWGDWALYAVAADGWRAREPLVRVPTAEDLSNLSLRLEPTRDVVGFVSNSDGHRVAAGRLSVRLGRGHGTRIAETNDAGEFRLLGLPRKPLSVLIEADGLVTKKVTVGPEESELHLTLMTAGRVLGRAVRADSMEPVSRFEVEYWRRRGGTLGASPQTTDFVETEDGAFSSPDLTPGEWVVRIRARGAIVRATEILQVSAGSALDLGEISLEAGATARGEVRDAATFEPVPGALVQIIGDEDLSAIAEPDGSFELLGLPRGEFLLEARAETYPRRNLLHRHRIRINEDGEVEPAPLQFLLRKGGSVEGRVESASGDPVSGVAVHDERMPRRVSVTGEDGRFRLEGLPEGETVLRGKGDPSIAGPVVVEAGRVASLTLRSRGARVRGRVLMDGLPIPCALRLDLPGGTVLRTFSNGDYELKQVPSGEWTVRVSAVDPLSGEPFSQDVQLLVPAGQSDLHEDLDVRDSAPERLSVSGTLVDKTSGDPIPSWQLVFRRMGGLSKAVRTNQRGEFAATLAPGKYSVRPMPPPNDILEWNAPELELSLQRDRADVVLLAERRKVRRIHVRDSSGVGLPNARVFLLRSAESSRTDLRGGTLVCVTDLTGQAEYYADDASQGQLLIVAPGRGFEVLPVRAQEEPQQVHLAARGGLALDTVPATLVGPSWYLDLGGTGDFHALIDQRGDSMTVSGLPPGDYVVAHEQGYRPVRVESGAVTEVDS